VSNILIFGTDGNFFDKERLYSYGDRCLCDYEDITIPTPNTNQTRWTVSVPKETDTSLRRFLAVRGMKKGDISKFIVDAVKWRVFEQTLAEVRQQVADIPPDEMQSIIDEAIDAVRQAKRNELLGKEA